MVVQRKVPLKQKQKNFSSLAYLLFYIVTYRLYCVYRYLPVVQQGPVPAPVPGPAAPHRPARPPHPAHQPTHTGPGTRAQGQHQGFARNNTSCLQCCRSVLRSCNYIFGLMSKTNIWFGSDFLFTKQLMLKAVLMVDSGSRCNVAFQLVTPYSPQNSPQYWLSFMFFCLEENSRLIKGHFKSVFSSHYYCQF